MKKILLGLFLLAATGCSSNGLTELKQMDSNFDKEIVMTNDSKQTAQVRNIVTGWMVDNGYKVSKETASPSAQLDDDQVMFEFNANWWWDIATYMRYVNLDVTDNKGNKVAHLDFDSVRYGGFDKFGDAEERLNIIMEVFFQKISIQDAEHKLEHGKDKSPKPAITCAYDCEKITNKTSL
ncbi:hypothetical protein GCM10007978_19060 [Shewanella hanedai]|uniref:Lipoprotein n=1 Tax=Shewanella hanedai TaxID=25 RepID=A0A553JP93_SHEHA|nr:Sbal_3080 family lipoprotein [Shewanella hanedai]TRY14282.1 hypothetical protein FN961_10645 [Shewanella hanedai]GGI81408.1 hypothetical protein GCM10007978_19060 [Shewanella hanedai]